MPVFSIIVPVHNAENTLRKCLESIRCQTCPDFEVLMVENGSVDTSNAICSEYAAADARFILFTCETNRGPSGARNIGLDRAKGEFVTFIDSDDFVETNYLETLQQSFAHADVVFFGYQQLLPDGAPLAVHLPHIPKKAGYYEMLVALHKQDMFGYTWIKAFRREIIGHHRFSTELNLLEDEVFACNILATQCRIGVVPQALYYYITGNAGSLMGRTHPDYCRKVDAAYCAWKTLLQNDNKKDQILAAMANAHVSRCMYYGFERDVNIKAFFNLLAASEFFSCSTVENQFTKCVRSGNYRMLAFMRAVYIAKNKLAKLLKKRGKQ